MWMGCGGWGEALELDCQGSNPSSPNHQLGGLGQVA